VQPAPHCAHLPYLLFRHAVHSIGHRVQIIDVELSAIAHGDLLVNGPTRVLRLQLPRRVEITQKVEYTRHGGVHLTADPDLHELLSRGRHLATLQVQRQSPQG
jgi:hypothetical protein